jgi:hypothetical protein
LLNMLPMLLAWTSSPSSTLIICEFGFIMDCWVLTYYIHISSFFFLCIHMFFSYLFCLQVL